MQGEQQHCIPNASGEAYITQFLLFVHHRGRALLSNCWPLKLQPRALEYLASRLTSLRELQQVRTSNPIEYFTGAVVDLEDYQRLVTLQKFLRRVSVLKLYSSSRGVRDPTPVDLSPFSAGLRSIEFRGCDLSSHPVAGISPCRENAEKVVAVDSIERLEHLLAPHGSSHTEVWPKLKHLSCMYNNVREMDSSLGLAPNLEVLDLSRNRISEVVHLERNSNLVRLDLSHNLLSNISAITSSCPNLRELILKGNTIRCLEGIESLLCIEVLDVRWNLIGSFKEVAKVARLPNTRKVALEGTPLSRTPHYRVNALACFGLSHAIELDGRPASEVELRRARRVVVSELGLVSSRAQELAAGIRSLHWLWGSIFPAWLCRRSRTRLLISRNAPSLDSSFSDKKRSGHRTRRVRVVEIPNPEDLSLSHSPADFSASNVLSSESSGTSRPSPAQFGRTRIRGPAGGAAAFGSHDEDVAVWGGGGFAG